MTTPNFVQRPSGTGGNGREVGARVVLRRNGTREESASIARYVSSEQFSPRRAILDYVPRVSVALITTFAPEPYVVKQPVPLSIYLRNDEYVASFFDGNIHTSGENEQEAFENVKSLILDTFDEVSSWPRDRLAPRAIRQLIALEEYIAKQ